MPFLDDLLIPIEGANPSGANLRYDPVYDRIKEARREEDQPPAGMTERDRKVADNPQVIKLATGLLQTKTKDLQIAAWLTEALLKQKGFGGLKDGLALCLGLVDKFWDTLYPELEDGDAQSRGGPLGFVGSKLDIPVRLVPVVEKAPYGLLDQQQSREVGYEDQAKTDETKKKRAQLLKEGKLAPENFDKAFEETTKKFYAQSEQDLDACLETLARLKKICDEKFGDDGPAFGPLQSALEADRHLIHGFLQKKREKEPDPVEPTPVAEVVADAEGAEAGEGPSRTSLVISVENSSEPADRVDAIRKVAEAAAFLRRREPKSPASYLMLRGLRWGELRAAIDLSDPTKLEAPPTELRRHIKRLLLEKKYEQLLEAAEGAMALPCSRAWLDLQRFVVEACEALGSDYEAIARAIRSELNALITDIPQLLDATLMDDTPAANMETRTWLKSLSQGVSPGPRCRATTPTTPSSDGQDRDGPANPPTRMWRRYRLCARARSGRPSKSFSKTSCGSAPGESDSIARCNWWICVSQRASRTLRSRFWMTWPQTSRRTNSMTGRIPAMVANALSAILKLSQRVQNDAAQRQKLFRTDLPPRSCSGVRRWEVSHGRT